MLTYFCFQGWGEWTSICQNRQMRIRRCNNKTFAQFDRPGKKYKNTKRYKERYRDIK